MSKEKDYSERELEPVDLQEILEYCAATNTPDFNFDKAFEEATEFNEALIKLKTKNKNNPKRPAIEEVLKEYGDFLYRGMIALKTLMPEKTLEQIEDEVNAHIVYKLSKLIEYRKSRKYEGGL